MNWSGWFPGLLLSKPSLRPFTPTSLSYLLCPKSVFFLHLYMLPICMEHSPPLHSTTIIHPRCHFPQQAFLTSTMQLESIPHFHMCILSLPASLHTVYCNYCRSTFFFFHFFREHPPLPPVSVSATIFFYKTLPRDKFSMKVTNQDFGAPYLPRPFQGPGKVRCFLYNLKKKTY